METLSPEDNVILQASIVTPRNTFFDLSNNKQFKQAMRGKKKGGNLLTFRTANPVSREELNFSATTTPLQFITMRILESSKIFFGYLFEIPDFCELDIKPDRVSICRKRLAEYANVTLRYQDNFLNVFSSPQGALLLTTSKIKLFDPNIIREQRMSKGD